MCSSFICVCFSVTGCESQSVELRLPHVSLLHFRPHEEECRLLPAAVQLQVHHLVVNGPQPPHRHLRLPAAPLPQKTLHHQDVHRGGEAALLTDSDLCSNTWICLRVWRKQSHRGCWCCVCVRCNTLHTITTQNSLSSSTEQHMCDFFIQH